MQTADGIVLENYKKYGYPNIGELFRPHITFTKFADPEVKDISRLPAVGYFSGQFVKLGLFEMGDYGTCVRELYSTIQ